VGMRAATGTMLFTYAYERTIDSKSRLQIPAPWREAWESAREKPVLYICPGVRENTLALYTECYFESWVARLQTEHMAEPDSLDFEQAFFGSVLRQELDGQGRIIIPDGLLRMTDLGKEVVLSGSKVRIDIWRRSDYAAFMGVDAKKRWVTFHKYMRMPTRASGDLSPQ